METETQAGPRAPGSPVRVPHHKVKQQHMQRIEQIERILKAQHPPLPVIKADQHAAQGRDPPVGNTLRHAYRRRGQKAQRLLIPEQIKRLTSTTPTAL